ncbi:MAG TPA: FAD-linked oxidase C-terminal domain-containing protein [Solirubrobacteraceae bacterium]|nr:FAD-linked oxidase C-terminal domain-containing protein [Solirubrobacteraceae bacterium]
MGSLQAELAALIGEDAVRAPAAAELQDETEARGAAASADAYVTPRSTAEVALVLAHCNERRIAVTPRGGGSGLAGGAVPLRGGIVLGLERMRGVRAFDPRSWRICVEAGLQTAHVHRLARENGLLFPPDPGAAEQSQIGGNIATNAGGPHAFKYGSTGAWVTGLEAVLASGEVIEIGGPIRKDVAGYDLRALLVGSEGTLAVITAAWLRLTPAPEAALPVVGLYATIAAGSQALSRVIESGLTVAALEYLDPTTVALASHGFPAELSSGGAMMVIAEADGSRPEAERLAAEVADVLSDDADAVFAPTERAAVEALWRWRHSVSLTVKATLGAKISEDIVVPFERLGEAIEATLEIGARHELRACSWGHAGDGNLHSTFLVAPGDDAALARAGAACEELFSMAIAFGGSVTGEHGLGWVKGGRLVRQWPPAAVRLHEAVKTLFDPNNILNPGKKLAR